MARDSPCVRNLPSLFIEITSLGGSSSGIPPQGVSWWLQQTCRSVADSFGIPQQGAGSSSKAVDIGDLLYVAFNGTEARHRIPPIWSLHLKVDFS